MNQRKHEALSPELTASLVPANVDDLLVSLKYYVDEDFAHIKIADHKVCSECAEQPCLHFCPAGVFSADRVGKILVSYQGCVECGSCRIGCPFQNIDWELPRGGYGVAYKFG